MSLYIFGNYFCPIKDYEKVVEIVDKEPKTVDEANDIICGPKIHENTIYLYRIPHPDDPIVQYK